MADYLSREEILRVFDNLTVKNPDDKYQHGMQDAIDCLIPEVINGMEAKDVQPIRRGQWKYYKNNGIIDTYICTNCENKVEMSIDVEPSSFCYCPKCGASMNE